MVWRYQDENNYYIVRANALEGNVVLYKVEKGSAPTCRLKARGAYYGRRPVPRRVESTCGVCERESFQVQLNGTLYEVDDATFTGARESRCWTKADSVTHFDDLTVTVR